MASTGTQVDGLVVRHDCDNPPCCNPAHLRVGTHKDNALDRDVKGRLAKAKLTPVEVMQIRQRSALGEPLSDIARFFGTSYANAWNVATRKTWKHL
jgi:hypothetical protein